MTHLHHLPADSTTIGARFGSRGETPFSGGRSRAGSSHSHFWRISTYKRFLLQGQTFSFATFFGWGIFSAQGRICVTAVTSSRRRRGYCKGRSRTAGRWSCLAVAFSAENSWKMLRVVEEWYMQSRSEEFRAHAAECRELASHVRDLELKRQYEELARQWLELAEQAERHRRH
jgi:hypothetical protein